MERPGSRRGRAAAPRCRPCAPGTAPRCSRRGRAWDAHSRIGIFHEFVRRPGSRSAESFDEGFDLVDAAEQWGLDAVWLAELHFSPATLGAGGAADDCRRHRRPHQPHQDRHRRPGAAAGQPAAPGRRGRHRRPPQPWPADLRRRPQRLSPAPTRRSASPTPRAASASPRRWRSSARPGPKPSFSFEGAVLPATTT